MSQLLWYVSEGSKWLSMINIPRRRIILLTPQWPYQVISVMWVIWRFIDKNFDRSLLFNRWYWRHSHSFNFNHWSVYCAIFLSTESTTIFQILFNYRFLAEKRLNSSSHIWMMRGLLVHIIKISKRHHTHKYHTVEAWEWISNFIPHYIRDVITSMMGLKIIHVNKRVPCTSNKPRLVDICIV